MASLIDAKGKDITDSAARFVSLKGPVEVYQMAYWSRNKLGGDPRATKDAIRSILTVSRRANPQLGITGVLLFNQDYFAQVLEGPRSAVEYLFDRIMQDRRHGSIVVVHERAGGALDFGTWSMACVRDIPLVDMIPDHSAFDAMIMNPSRKGVALVEMLRYLVREQPSFR